MQSKEKTAKGIEECHEIYYDFERVVRIGDYDYERPQPPQAGDVINFGLEKQDRKFPLYPRDITDSMSEDELIEFVAEEQRRLDEGIHFYNGDKLEYVTGKHYFMLQWWVIQSKNMGLYEPAMFMDSQRDLMYHWDCVEKDPNCLGAVWGTSRGVGKALCIDTPIPTIDGFKLMKDISVGDVVFDNNGKPCNVTFTTGIQYNRIVNRVWFDDGTYLDADDDHLWEVSVRKDRRSKSKDKTIKRVLTTKDIKESELHVKSGKWREANYHIDITKPVDFSHKELPIDPYLFGYWLGDGDSYSSSLSCGVDDIKHLINYLDKINQGYKVLKEKSAYRIVLTSEGSKRNELGQYTDNNSIQSKLVKLGFIKRKKEDGRFKRIPDIYKQSSIEQRRELIRGILDSDGSICKKSKSIEITQKSKVLINDIAEVLRSLGEKCVLNKKTATMKRADGSVYVCDVYRIHTNLKFLPFKIKRKADRWHYPKSKRRFIKSIEKIEEIETKPVKCISVDSERNLYLAGKEYIVTHNTILGSVISYTTSMMLEGAKIALQSKTDKDAIEIFLKIQESWQRLPDFFKPIDSGESRRSRSLLWQAPKKSSTKGGQKEYQYVLDSWIKPFPAKNTALDGLRFRFGYFDEEGKVEKGVADVDERWNINKKCFMSMDSIIGKSLHTTTVEHMEKLGGAKFKKIWDASHPKTIDPLLKRTASGLRKFFISADYGYKIDEWGYSKREESLAIHKAEMAKLEGEDLISYKRKHPLSESDMFLTDAKGSPWHIGKLQQTKIHNEEEFVYDTNRIGNFYWKNGEENEVGFQEDKDGGRWIVNWMPPQEDRNQYQITGYGREPTREYVRIGVDPTNLKAPTTGSGSDNAAYAVLDIGYMGNKRPRAVCEYLYRQHHPTDFAEDIRMMAIFYSARVFVENNAGSVLIRHFENKRCEEYLMYNLVEQDLKKRYKERGFYNATNGGIRETLVNTTRAHIVEDLGYLGVDDSGIPEYGVMPFERLIEDLLDFEVDNWTPYDATVAYMIAILACKMSRLNTIEYNENKVEDDFNVMRFHKLYKVN